MLRYSSLHASELRKISNSKLELLHSSRAVSSDPGAAPTGCTDDPNVGRLGRAFDKFHDFDLILESLETALDHSGMLGVELCTDLVRNDHNITYPVLPARVWK